MLLKNTREANTCLTKLLDVFSHGKSGGSTSRLSIRDPRWPPQQIPLFKFPGFHPYVLTIWDLTSSTSKPVCTVANKLVPIPTLSILASPVVFTCYIYTLKHLSQAHVIRYSIDQSFCQGHALFHGRRTLCYGGLSVLTPHAMWSLAGQ